MINHIINGILDTADKPKFDPDADISSIRARANSGSTFASTNSQAGSLSGFGEGASIVLSAISLFFSYPAQFEKGSGKFETADTLEVVLWSTRMVALGVDSGMTMFGGQRMRRLQPVTEIGWAIYHAVDLILFSAFFLTEKDEDKDPRVVRGSNISNEVFSWLPNFVCSVRGLAVITPEPGATILWAIHLGTDFAAFITSLVTGSLLIKEDNKALSAAKKLEAVV